MVGVFGVSNQVLQSSSALLQELGSIRNMFQVLSNGGVEFSGEEFVEGRESLEEVVQEITELMRSEEILEGVAEFSDSVVEFRGVEFFEAGHSLQHLVESVLHIGGEVITESLEGFVEELHEVDEGLGQEFDESFKNVFKEFSKLRGFVVGFHGVGAFGGVFGVHVAFILGVRSGSNL